MGRTRKPKGLEVPADWFKCIGESPTVARSLRARSALFFKFEISALFHRLPIWPVALVNDDPHRVRDRPH